MEFLQYLLMGIGAFVLIAIVLIAIGMAWIDYRDRERIGWG